jgi:hypothetical protein
MTETDEQKIRAIVRSELLEILQDAQDALGMKKDPTGFARKALEGLSALIRQRDREDKREEL